MKKEDCNGGIYFDECNNEFKGGISKMSVIGSDGVEHVIDPNAPPKKFKVFTLNIDLTKQSQSEIDANKKFWEMMANNLCFIDMGTGKCLNKKDHKCVMDNK